MWAPLLMKLRKFDQNSKSSTYVCQPVSSQNSSSAKKINGKRLTSNEGFLIELALTLLLNLLPNALKTELNMNLTYLDANLLIESSAFQLLVEKQIKFCTWIHLFVRVVQLKWFTYMLPHKTTRQTDFFCRPHTMHVQEPERKTCSHKNRSRVGIKNKHCFCVHAPFPWTMFPTLSPQMLYEPSKKAINH